MPTASESARELVRAINAHAVAALAELMTDDHELGDAIDNFVRGREHSVRAWRTLLALIPDHALALVLRDGRVAAWRAYCDAEALRRPCPRAGAPA